MSENEKKMEEYANLSKPIRPDFDGKADMTESKYHRLNELQRECWEIAEGKGFHDDLKWNRHGTLVRLCLIHTEVSEAAQVIKRHGVNRAYLGEFAAELADIVIRLFDLAEGMQIDLGQIIFFKNEQNRKRPYKYGTPDEKT